MGTNGFISYIAFIFLGIGIVLIIIAVILLIRYIKQVTAFKKYKPAWEKHKSIYDDFAIELNHWYDSGLPPKSCDGDTSYTLRLQRERLGRKGIRMIHYTAPAKETPGTTYFSRNTAWYTVDLMNEHITRRLRFENSSGIIYDRDSDDTMYESVVHTPNDNDLPELRCRKSGFRSDTGLPLLQYRISGQGSVSTYHKYIFYPG